MPPEAHAILSASASHRWLHCPPSALLERTFEDHPSEAAAEGTAAHALCEHKLRKILRERSRRPKSDFDSDEMESHTDGYVAYVQESIAKAKETWRDPVVRIEQRLDFSDWVPSSFGTADCIIVGTGILHVIDFKYGQEVLVDADHNSQMMLYALGALKIFDALYDIRGIRLTIFQPRRDNLSEWSLTAEELKRWAEDILIPTAALAAKGEGESRAGDWCTFCKAKHTCRARAEANLALARYEFAEPPLLTDPEICDILTKAEELSRWANEVAAYARAQALNGRHFPGFKLVEGRSNRCYADDAAVAEAAKAAGFEDIWQRSLLPVTEMERYMGRQNIRDILGPLIIKPPGKPTLVPESDKRPPMNLAANDFIPEND